MNNHTVTTQNTINVALHVHFTISDSVEDAEALTLQETFEKAFLHEASHFGMHPPKDADGGKKEVYVLPVKAQGANLQEALQNAEAWAREVAERDAPTGLSITKIEATAAEHDW